MNKLIDAVLAVVFTCLLIWCVTSFDTVLGQGGFRLAEHNSFETNTMNSDSEPKFTSLSIDDYPGDYSIQIMFAPDVPKWEGYIATWELVNGPAVTEYLPWFVISVSEFYQNDKCFLPDNWEIDAFTGKEYREDCRHAGIGKDIFIDPGSGEVLTAEPALPIYYTGSRVGYYRMQSYSAAPRPCDLMCDFLSETWSKCKIGDIPTEFCRAHVPIITKNECFAVYTTYPTNCREVKNRKQLFSYLKEKLDKENK
ncbi:hypothetical protein LCGC14_2476620 [marine sediment metagenome]|uniref:Uncharacterized protein n=1 Tax=marine sediment metagenome TaxID=412755 RepID=A0A0F9BWR6_9ZZZZ